jgi:hypothetical protein
MADAEGLLDECWGTQDVAWLGAKSASPVPSPLMCRVLDRNIERALRHEFGAASGLRPVVRQIVAELTLRGASQAAMGTFLRQAVRDHACRPTYDRVSLVTGISVSDALVEQMLQWGALRSDRVAPRAGATAQK